MIQTIVKPEILKVNVCVGVQLPGGLHKGVHEFVVLGASDPFVRGPEIQVIVEELLVIGTTVQDDGKGTAWVDASAEGG